MVFETDRPRMSKIVQAVGGVRQTRPPVKDSPTCPRPTQGEVRDSVCLQVQVCLAQELSQARVSLTRTSVTSKALDHLNQRDLWQLSKFIKSQLNGLQIIMTESPSRHYHDYKIKSLKTSNELLDFLSLSLML